MRITSQENYNFYNAPIPGGGYVTGFYFHPVFEKVLYCRTDIGGSYRYDYDKNQWVSLIDAVTHNDKALTYPLALGFDNGDADTLFVVAGNWLDDEGVFAISKDRGETYEKFKIPTKVHGNMPGRGSGERLAVDKRDSNKIWFASQTGGLMHSADGGKSWEKLSVPVDVTTFVWVSDDNRIIVCGTAGCDAGKPVFFNGERFPYVKENRGHGLYVSYDGGNSFEEMSEPVSFGNMPSDMRGLSPIRYDFDGRFLYVTFAESGTELWWKELSYSCDTKNQHGGRVVRYELKDGIFDGFVDITPNEKLWTSPAGTVLNSENPGTDVGHGYEAICSCKAKPGLLVTATICRQFRGGDAIFISEDYGASWRLCLYEMKIGGMHFNTAYMKPEYNGGENLIHWMSDVRINPHNPNECHFTTGTGAFGTDKLLDVNPAFHDTSDGIEETVHINVYAPLAGDVKLVDLVGDLGGFAFVDLHKPCENSFANDNGDRYITCINADINDENPDFAMISARGNWTNATMGGIIVTRDNFKTFERLSVPYGLTERLDMLLAGIETPNTNPGWIALSSDCNTYVWSVVQGIFLDVKDVVTMTIDGSVCPKLTMIYDLNGDRVTTGGFKAFSDRVDADIFYGFGEKGQVYVSRDRGYTFYEKKPVKSLPEICYTEIDTKDDSEIRGVAGVSGVFYISTGKPGLVKLIYDKDTDTVDVISLINEPVYRVGIGIGKDEASYINGHKALYICADIDGQYGFYRTEDEGKTFVRLGNDNQCYGQITSIDADKREFGRFYIGTGSVGVKVGEPK